MFLFVCSFNNIFASGHENFQEQINNLNYFKLESYVTVTSPDNPHALGLLSKLKHQMLKHSNKNVAILELVQQIVRSVGGVRVTCCKSGKDRTGMGVTLEEARCLFNMLQLDENEDSVLFQTILDTLRR